jgi:hypothetical protein
MRHRHNMTAEQKLKWDCDSYKKRLEANKGSNYQYWNNKHNELLMNGWKLFLISENSKKHSTSSKYHAIQAVEQLRNEGNYARIVCGYNKNRQRIKMYSVIYKPKKTTS